MPEKDNEWRSGPGALWYDLASVPHTSTNFDYGFKLATKVLECDILGTCDIHFGVG